jgi:hypothetical protein
MENGKSLALVPFTMSPVYTEGGLAPLLGEQQQVLNWTPLSIGSRRLSRFSSRILS